MESNIHQLFSQMPAKARKEFMDEKQQKVRKFYSLVVALKDGKQLDLLHLKPKFLMHNLKQSPEVQLVQKMASMTQESSAASQGMEVDSDRTKTEVSQDAMEVELQSMIEQPLPPTKRAP